jgi:putative hydrolase of the HAD superfamily
MDRLGVVERFSGIFDIVAAGYLPKPERAAYEGLIRAHDLDPRRAALFEDLARNLVPAAALGMTTVLIRSDGQWAPEVAEEAAEGEHIHHVTDDLAGWLEKAAEALRPSSH